MIYEFQAKEIKDALRMVSNAYDCREKKTCMDRTVCKAIEFIDKVLSETNKK